MKNLGSAFEHYKVFSKILECYKNDSNLSAIGKNKLKQEALKNKIAKNKGFNVDDFDKGFK